MLKFGSLFSGIGGLDLGLERAGMRCIWQSDIDIYACKVLKKHWPDVPNLGDIKQIKEALYVDLICGGFPCQPVSVAGKRKGESDERWLWPEYFRIIQLVRPRFVCIENVRGLRRRGMRTVLADLASIGFDAQWARMWASDFGACHRRERIIIIAYPSCEQLQLEQGWSRRPNREDSLFTNCISKARRTPRTPEGFITPRMDRAGNGIPNRIHRLKCLGNAVVPQVAEYIGNCILDSIQQGCEQ